MNEVKGKLTGALATLGVKHAAVLVMVRCHLSLAVMDTAKVEIGTVRDTGVCTTPCTACPCCMQDFANDLRVLFADVDALDMGPLMRPGADVQAAATSMANDAGVNNLVLRVSFVT